MIEFQPMVCHRSLITYTARKRSGSSSIVSWGTPKKASSVLTKPVLCVNSLIKPQITTSEMKCGK